MRKIASLGRIGLGGCLVALVVGWFAATTLYPTSHPRRLVDSGVAVGTTGNLERTPAEARRVDFVHAVMKDAQDAWRVLLPSDYEPPRVVLFRDAIDAACGALRAATGPFYCPGDERVYLDLGFLEELRDRFGALGDFAPAYVIAHEIGHHIQHVTGIERRARKAMERGRRRDANSVSVELELQADCFAGVWAHVASPWTRAASGKLELGGQDVKEELNAAAAIGDDRLQRMTTGRVEPDTFTHATSAQRVEWFERGLTSGRPAACSAFQSAQESD